MTYGIIITAGGTSSRFGQTNKLLEKINNKEVIRYTLEAFENLDTEKIVICANKNILETLKKMFKDNEKIHVIEGGNTRQQSVYKGLKELKTDYVIIHDGARPLIRREMIEKVMKNVIEKKALTVVTKTTDTIKKIDNDGRIIQTIDRSQLYNTQTPQAFEYNLIKTAHEKLQDKNFTDDASMAEYLGKDVYVLEGDYRNIKITTKADIAIAQIYLNDFNK